MKMKKRLYLSLALLAFFLLSACVPKESEAPAISPDPTVIITLGGPPSFVYKDREFRRLVRRQYGKKKIIRAEVSRHDGLPPSDCFLARSFSFQIPKLTAVYWMEDGQEVCYALSNTAELTAKQRLDLERQLQAYAGERGLRYSYFYSQHFMIAAFAKEDPELWVRFALEAYQNDPETVYVLDEAEIRLQHQVLLEHTILEIQEKINFE